MNLGKYIHDLLLNNETVIVPGFGAFVSKRKPAEILANEIKPPSKEITFSGQIRNNDGVLVGYVSGMNKISHFDALKSIEKERDNVVFSLEKGERVNLDKIGVLFRNENGEIEFNPLEGESHFTDLFGLEKVELNQEETDENLEEPGMPVIEESEFNSEDQPEEEIVAAGYEESGFSDEPEISEETNSEKIKEEIQEEEGQQPETVAAPVPEQKVTAHVIPQAIVVNKKRGVWWYLLILIPVLIAGYFVIQQDKNNDEPVMQQPAVETGKQQVETMQPDSAGMANSDSISETMATVDSTKLQAAEPVQPKTVKQKPAANGETVFYLVGGSFREQENADTYLAELKEKGFEPFHLGKRGNFYLVGVGKFGSESEAVVARRDFTERNGGSGAWILEE